MMDEPDRKSLAAQAWLLWPAVLGAILGLAIGVYVGGLLGLASGLAVVIAGVIGAGFWWEWLERY